MEEISCKEHGWQMGVEILSSSNKLVICPKCYFRYVDKATKLDNLTTELESMTILRDAAWEEIANLRAEIVDLKSLVLIRREDLEEIKILSVEAYDIADIEDLEDVKLRALKVNSVVVSILEEK